MIDSKFDTFDHEMHMQEALKLARESAARGDEPFGSVLVRDDTVVMRESNPVRSANILDGITEITGPLLNDEGRQVHEEYNW